MIRNKLKANYYEGFTLIELLVVISIIGMLGSIILVSLQGARQKASMAAGQVQESNILNSLGDAAVVWLDFTGCPNIQDMSALNSAVTFVNNPTCGTQVPSSGYGSSISLNGTNSYINVPDHANLKFTGGSLTIGFWMYANSTENSGASIISKPWNGSGNYNYRVGINNDNTVFVCVAADGGACPTFSKVDSQRWYYVVTVLTGSTINLYLNGKLAGTQAYTMTSWTPVNGDINIPLAIGTLYPYGSGTWSYPAHAFDGYVDDVRIYTRTLTSQEIYEQYFATRDQYVSTLVAR